MLKKHQIIIVGSIGIVLCFVLLIFIVKLSINLYKSTNYNNIKEEVTELSHIFVSNYTDNPIKFELFEGHSIKPEVIAKLQNEISDKVVENDADYKFDLETYYEDNYKYNEAHGVVSSIPDEGVEQDLSDIPEEELLILDENYFTEEEREELAEMEKQIEEDQVKWQNMQEGIYEERIKYTEDNRAYIELKDFHFVEGYDTVMYKGYSIAISRSEVPYTREEIAQTLNYQYIFNKVVSDDKYIAVVFLSINSKAKLTLKWKLEDGEVVDVETVYTVL